MRFIIEDVDPQKLPSEADLKIWFQDNIDRFVQPATRSFSHIYMSPDKHGSNLEAHAQDLLAQLQNAQIATDWRTLGDPFIMKKNYETVSQADARRLFGPDFAKGLFSAPSQSWHGPVDSAFGRHLIRIETTTDGQAPTFDTVREQVENLWREEAGRAKNQAELKALIKRYKVNVEDLAE